MKLTLSRFTHHVSRCFLVIVFCLVATLSIAQSVSAQVVAIPDPNLKKALQETLQLPDNAPITQQEMLHLTRLHVESPDLNNLTGLEHAINLEDLFLGNVGMVSDLNPISNLTSLRNLNVGGNQISDIRPLASLIHLAGLSLYDNSVADIAPLANLTNLTYLNLAHNGIETLEPLAGLIHLLFDNRIKDIAPIANMTALTKLILSHNQVRNLNPLANLTQLEELRLAGNTITNLTSLIELKDLKVLHLADNPIHDFSPLLELEGVELDIEIDLSRLDELNIVIEIPDPNLKQAIRETLSVPDEVPLMRGQMLQLTWLAASDRGITDLTGIEHAINLTGLGLFNNQVQDIAPLANLMNLWYLNLALNRVENLEPLAGLVRLETLDLWENQVKDITPIANLTNLRTLILNFNQVSDLTALAKLNHLKILDIRNNLANDFTPLQGLNLVEFYYDEVCDIPPILPIVRERIENRNFPSVFQMWDHVVGQDHLTVDQRYALHDLHSSPHFELSWHVTAAEPTYGIATSLKGNLARSREIHNQRLELNPNMIFLYTVNLRAHFTDEAFPPGSNFWLRDSNGEIITRYGGDPYINFLKPNVQDLLMKRIVAVGRCGLYDGVMLDEFFNNGTWGSDIYSATEEEMIQAFLNIFRAVRSQVREDFLVLINTNRTKATRYTEYVNGSFMETGSDNEYLLGIPGGYTHDGLKEIESTLLWSEKNLRSPQINCLEGWGIPSEPPDSPENRRWMRVFTTMSLTLSDGYVMYNTGTGAVRVSDTGYPWGPGHEHIWYPFWDTNLGHPVGKKAQSYQDIEGLFIREFTNGWAVYNRSGNAQTITLPASTTPVSDRGNNAASLIHLLPDLDGEIYLTTKSFADVNRDGKVDVLDMVQVANGLGKTTPDPNGDGVVNILDLVFVAQQFSQ